MDGELTVWNLVVATCQSNMTTLISDHVKDKQLIYGLHTTVIYTPCLSPNALQHPSDPETFRAESCLLSVVSVQTRS